MGASSNNRAIGIMLLAAVSLCIFHLPSLAGITFERTYGGAGRDYGYSIQETLGGGYVIGGWTTSFGAGKSDFYVLRIDSVGNMVWDATYGGPNDETGRYVRQTADGGYVAVGTTGSFGAGSFDAYLVKADSSGGILWERTYGGSDTDWAACVRETSDHGYIIAGYTTSYGNGGKDLYLVRTDSSGNVIWDTTYGGTLDDFAYSVEQTRDGGYIATGATSSFGVGSLDVYVVRIDSSGNSLWEHTYGGTSDDVGMSMSRARDGGYVIGGWTTSFGAGWDDFYAIRIDSMGVLAWDTTYGGSEIEWGCSIHETMDHGYVIAGMTWSFGEGMSDAYVVKADSLGNVVWGRTYGGSEFEWGRCIEQTLDGGYVIAGYTSSFGVDSTDVYVIKTDENGLTGVDETGGGHLVSHLRCELLQNCPNPFGRSTVIRYSLPRAGEVTLAIYNIAGRLVETLMSETQQPGIHQVQWDRKASPSGVYFCRLKAGGFVETRKMAVVE